MYRQPAVLPHGTVSSGWQVAQSGQLDALIGLERIGTRLLFAHDQEIYAEGEPGNAWFRVLSGTVRVSKLLADGRRHVAEFCFAGDSFGFEHAAERGFSAEAVTDASVLRLPFAATEQLAEENLRSPIICATRC